MHGRSAPSDPMQKRHPKTKLSRRDTAPASDTSFIKHGTPAFLRTNLALFAAGFATFALLYWVQPVMPVFSRSFGVGAVGASLSLSLTTAVLAISMPFVSSASEVHGRKIIMVASLLLSGILTLVCAGLSHWPTLLVMRALSGLALSGLPAVAMAYVSEEMHPKSMAFAMGLYIAGSGIGGMSGRLITGVVSDFWGWRIAALVIGTLGIGCGLILWRSLPRSRHFVPQEAHPAVLLRSFKSHLSDPGLLLLFAEGFLLMGCFVTVYNYISYRLLAPPFGLSQTEVGLIFTVYLAGVVSSALMGAAAARFGRRAILWLALAIMIGGTLLTLSHLLWLIIAGMAILTFGFFGGHAVASSWVGARARQAKAQASSLYLFAYYLGSSVLGSLGGAFWDHWHWAGVIAMTGAGLAVALAIALRFARLKPLSPAA